MVDIFVDDSKLQFKISGQYFHELIELFKLKFGQYNAELKTWQFGIPRLKEIVEEIQYIGDTVSIDAQSQKEINLFFENLKELKVADVRRKYIPELLKFGPLQGKPPYEKFQLQDSVRALQQNRYSLIHDTGLGKSWITSFLITHGFYYKLFNKALILSTGIGVLNLKAELLKFCNGMEDSDIAVYTGVGDCDAFLGNRLVFETNHKIIIMTYDCFKGVNLAYYLHKNPKAKRTTKFKKSCIQWNSWSNVGLFLDEHHSLANPKSDRSNSIFMNLQHWEYRYLFSATPADVYQKLYPMCYILDQHLVEGLSYNEWLAQYNDVGNKWSVYAVNPNGWHLDKIAELNKKLLNTYGSKRLKKDCLDLPDNYEVPTIKVQMTESHRKIYETFINENAFMEQKRAQQFGSDLKENMLNLFQYLQLSIDNPQILMSNPKFEEFTPELQARIKNFNFQKDLAKLKVLDTILDERINENEEKIIVWCYHPVTIQEVATRYKKYNPFVLDVSVSKEKRFDVIKDFKSSDSKLIVLSIMIANTSITLTECKAEVYLEKVYNYTAYDQSRGRIVRPGQDQITRTYDMCYENSIDYMQSLNLKTKGQTLSSLLNKKFIDAQLWKSIFNMNDRVNI